MIELYVVFGDFSVKEAEDENWEEVARIFEDSPNTIIKRVFETEAEAYAYRCGLEDADGWLSAYPLLDEEVELLSKHMSLEDIEQP